MTKEPITPSSLFHYGMLAMPVAFAGFPLYVLAPDFYATEYGVSLAALGMVLLGLRLFDAFQDPLIGTLSDRYRSHASSIIIFPAAILCASIYGLFTQLYFSPLLWFAFSIGLAVTAYSILNINLNALGALWTKDSYQQTRIASSREAFALLGLISAVTLPGLLAERVSQEQVYHWFSLILTALMIISLLFFLKWLWKQPKNSYASKSKSFFSTIKTLSLDSRKLLIVYLISMIASSIPAVLVIFFIRDLLGTAEYVGLFLLLYFFSGVCFMPVWKRISLTLGKHLSWLLSMVLAVASFIWAFTLGEGDIWQYAIICIGSGMALGGDLVFPPSILADHLHLNQSENSASTHYALLTLVAKTSLALASATSLPLLESVGFVPKSENSAYALRGLNIAYALIPSMLKCGAAFLLWRLFIYFRKGTIMKTIKLITILGGLIMLSSCYSTSLEYYNNTTPKADMKEYFNGPIKAWGIVQDWRGRVVRRFDVDMVGVWKGDTGTLTEHFEYYDGEKQKRVWTIKKLPDGRYEGTASDIIDKASGQANGYAIRWNYVMDLPVGDTTYRIRFDDWMWAMNDGVLVNRSYLKKLGFTVAELTLFMQKQKP